jgi:hypothetical protein
MPFWFLRNVVEMGYDAGLYRNKAAVQRQTGHGGNGADNSSDSLATTLGTGHIFSGRLRNNKSEIYNIQCAILSSL